MINIEISYKTESYAYLWFNKNGMDTYVFGYFYRIIDNVLRLYKTMYSDI